MSHATAARATPSKSSTLWAKPSPSPPFPKLLSNLCARMKFFVPVCWRRLETSSQLTKVAGELLLDHFQATAVAVAFFLQELRQFGFDVEVRLGLLLDFDVHYFLYQLHDHFNIHICWVERSNFCARQADHFWSKTGSFVRCGWGLEPSA